MTVFWAWKAGRTNSRTTKISSAAGQRRWRQAGGGGGADRGAFLPGRRGGGLSAHVGATPSVARMGSLHGVSLPVGRRAGKGRRSPMDSDQRCSADPLVQLPEGDHGSVEVGEGGVDVAPSRHRRRDRSGGRTVTRWWRPPGGPVPSTTWSTGRAAYRHPGSRLVDVTTAPPWASRSPRPILGARSPGQERAESPGRGRSREAVPPTAGAGSARPGRRPRPGRSTGC